MNDDISNKVRALLEDPDMLAKIASIAGGLGLGNNSSAATNTSTAPDNTPQTSIPTDNYNSDSRPPVVSAPTNPKPPANFNLPTKTDPRLALLNSIKPFLRADRQPKVDNLTRALTVANLFGSLRDKK